MRKPISQDALKYLDELREKYPSYWEYPEAYLEDDLLAWFQNHGADYYTYVKRLERAEAILKAWRFCGPMDDGPYVDASDYFDSIGVTRGN